MSNVLDQPMFDQEKPPFLPVALRFGLFGGLVLIIYSLVSNLLGFSSPSNGIWVTALSGLVSLAIVIVMPVLAVMKYRNDHLRGYIEFMPAFLTALVTSIIMVLIGQVFNYIYVVYIDPAFVETMMVEMAELYAKLGMAESDIEKALAGLEESLDPQKGMAKGLLWAAGTAVVTSAIIAAIMKRARPKMVV